MTCIIGVRKEADLQIRVRKPAALQKGVCEAKSFENFVIGHGLA